MPADVARPKEVHEYRSDSEHSDADEDLEAEPGPFKNKTMKKVNCRGDVRILNSMKLRNTTYFRGRIS